MVKSEQIQEAIDQLAIVKRITLAAETGGADLSTAQTFLIGWATKPLSNNG